MKTGNMALQQAAFRIFVAGLIAAIVEVFIDVLIDAFSRLELGIVFALVFWSLLVVLNPKELRFLAIVLGSTLSLGHYVELGIAEGAVSFQFWVLLTGAAVINTAGALIFWRRK